MTSGCKVVEADPTTQIPLPPSAFDDDDDEDDLSEDRDDDEEEESDDDVCAHSPRIHERYHTNLTL